MSSTYRTLLFIAIVGLAIATPMPQYDSEPQKPVVNETAGAPSLAEMETMKVITPIGAECFLMGNPHVYPLGLRVGIYLQWFATVLANFFVPSVASSMRGINTLFQIAVFSGLSYEITNMDALDGIEVFILLTLCIGSVVCLITSPNMDVRVTRIGSISRLFVFLGIFMFGAWYWFTGYRYTAMTRCTQETLFLFFWKVHLYHWFMGFSQAVMIIGCLACTGALAYEIYYLMNIISNDGLKPTVSKVLQGNLHKNSVLGGVLQQERYAWVSGALLMIIFIVTAAFIATIEGSLKYSNTYLTFNLGSPVELIPFVVGLFGLIKVFVGMIAGAAKVINEGRSRSDTPEGKELGSRPSTGAGFNV